MTRQTLAILTDFDGTISDFDVSDFIYQNFAAVGIMARSLNLGEGRRRSVRRERIERCRSDQV